MTTPSVTCAWCGGWACGLDEDGDLECEACTRLRLGRPLADAERVARVDALARKMKMAPLAQAAATREMPPELLCDLVADSGLRRAWHKSGPAIGDATTRMLTVDGRTQSVRAWAKERGMREDTVWSRLSRGYAPAAAVTPPAGARRAA